jgi:hypothetical protein
MRMRLVYLVLLSLLVGPSVMKGQAHHLPPKHGSYYRPITAAPPSDSISGLNIPLVLLIEVFVGIPLGCIPGIIAYKRKKRDKKLILWLGILTGWMPMMLLMLLWWALRREAIAPPPRPNVPRGSMSLR